MKKKSWRWLTSFVTVISLIGLLLIIAGETDMFHQILPKVFEPHTPINSIIRSIGGAFIGSGVFTAIIKSSEYTKIFSNVISDIIWSKKYIERRGDKKEIWSMVSKSMYDEKFPTISNDIEEIITEKYFPTSYNFFIENQEFTMNISNILGNENFWRQEETLKMIIKPTNSSEVINYRLAGNIDLPYDSSIPDVTSYTVNFVTVNNKPLTSEINDASVKDGKMNHILDFCLEKEEEYHIVYKRTKIVCKKTNPDKRFFGRYIVKNLKVTVIVETSMSVTLHRSGTIKDFVQEPDQVNNNVKVQTWLYNGVMLPYQGFIALLK